MGAKLQAWYTPRYIKNWQRLFLCALPPESGQWFKGRFGREPETCLWVRWVFNAVEKTCMVCWSWGKPAIRLGHFDYIGFGNTIESS